MTNVSLGGGAGGTGGSGVHASGGGVGGMGGGAVYGGLSMGGAGGSGSSGGMGGRVVGNIVKLTNVTLVGASGAQGGDNDASGGSSGGMGGGSVYGGLSIGGADGLQGSGGMGGDVVGNTVTLTNVTLKGAAGGNGNTSLYGGAGSGGMGGGSVLGGLSIGGAAGADAVAGSGAGIGGAVTSNTVTLNDVILNGASGGAGGEGAYGGANGIDGLDGGGVIGGLSIGGAGRNNDFNGSAGGDGGDVTDNKVSISGKSLIWGNIYGGYSHGGSAGYSIGAGDLAAGTRGVAGVGGRTINNIITLSGSDIQIGKRDINGNITQYGSVWGGRSINGDGTENSDFDRVMSGNTLNLIGYRGTLSGIYNFEKYNWTLPSDVVNGDTLIRIANGGTEVDLTNTTHSVSMYNDGSRLKAGDIITMIDKTKAQTYNTTAHTITQGQFIIYEATLEQQKNADDNTAFVLKVAGKTNTEPTDPVTPPTDPKPPVIPTKPDEGSAAKLNPQSRSYLEGRAGALALLNQGNDIIATAGIDKIRVMVRSNDEDRMPIIPFMIMNGSSQRYKTGSHIDLDSFNMALGIATGLKTNANHLVTIGGFFEYGHGTYDSYNSFTNFTSIYGDGDSNYKGGGVFGRVEFANTGLGRVADLQEDQADGFYLEASLRAGRISSSFDIGNSASMLGKLASDYRGSYKSKSGYYGGHVAGGYVFNFDDKQSLDVYGRYLWMHLNSDAVKIDYESLNFDVATSSRIQIGGRYSYAYSEQFKPYWGAAYEYEFDGDISARAYEFKLEGASLNGSTGIFEAGFDLQPIANDKALNINVNGQGYVGQRQGGGGGIKIKYQF